MSQKFYIHLYKIRFTFMNTRLQQFLTIENLTPARLADILGVQRSGMSHILSGRNKPGYDFIFKLCTKFPHLNANWFITGKGKPYKDSNAGSESESPSALSGNNSNNSNNGNHSNNGNWQNHPPQKIESEDIYKNNQRGDFINNESFKNNINYNQENAPISSDDDLFAGSDIFSFSEASANTGVNSTYHNENQKDTSENKASYPSENQINGDSKESAHKKKSVKRVIIFYSDGSFDELFPARHPL